VPNIQNDLGSKEQHLRDKIRLTFALQNAIFRGNLITKMQEVSRLFFSFTYRYWYPVAALAARTHLRS
jgi:hypothetical protein